jgi:alpha(1,3/1,4) fucosyltransferase
VSKIKIGIENFYECYNKQNSIFDKNAFAIGENLEYPFVKLKEMLKLKNAELDTLDMHPLEEYEKVIFLDMPNLYNVNFNRLLGQNKTKLYLVIFECEIIRKENWIKDNHKYFEKVFIWNDAWADDGKYIKYYLPNKIPDGLDFNIEDKEKLCTLIAGNKRNNDSRELYSERLASIKWFEENHIEDFDLYGVGWYGASYRGRVNRKSDVLKKYKFSICYENARDIPGNITEKIFDCFFCGCIPIYLGAPNISEHIPENTFIDKLQFKNYEDLYSYIKYMPETEYLNYIDNIKNYIESEEIKLFSAENFARVIATEIMEK